MKDSGWSRANALPLECRKRKHSSKKFKHSLFQAFFQMQMLTSERWLNVSENLEVLQGIQNAKKDTDASEMYELLPQASLKELSPLATVDAIMPRFPFSFTYNNCEIF